MIYLYVHLFSAIFQHLTVWSLLYNKYCAGSALFHIVQNFSILLFAFYFFHTFTIWFQYVFCTFLERDLESSFLYLASSIAVCSSVIQYFYYVIYILKVIIYIVFGQACNVLYNLSDLKRDFYLHLVRCAYRNIVLHQSLLCYTVYQYIHRIFVGLSVVGLQSPMAILKCDGLRQTAMV